jgi:hypothetical protein
MKKHWLMMLGCIAVMAIPFVGVRWFGWQGSYLWLLILLCPLVHYFMMKDCDKPHG